MFDLAYTLESYDLVPATEGIASKIGKGIKAAIDFIIKKIQRAIEFLTGKKKEASADVAWVKKNRSVPANHTINREKASKMQYNDNTHAITAKKLRDGISIIWVTMESIMISLQAILAKPQIDTSNMINRVEEGINKINDTINNQINPAYEKLKSLQKVKLNYTQLDLINDSLKRLQDAQHQYVKFMKLCDEKEISSEVSQLISKVVHTEGNAIDVVMKIVELINERRA